MIIELKFNIKREIKQRGLTVAEVCSRLKSDRMYISRITEEVKLNKVIRIANAIGCSPSDLLVGL
jgi:Helix-turn-helix.